MAGKTTLLRHPQPRLKLGHRLAHGRLFHDQQDVYGLR